VHRTLHVRAATRAAPTWRTLHRAQQAAPLRTSHPSNPIPYTLYTLSLCPGVVAVVDRLQVCPGDVGVDLRRGDIGVA